MDALPELGPARMDSSRRRRSASYHQSRPPPVAHIAAKDFHPTGPELPCADDANDRAVAPGAPSRRRHPADRGCPPVETRAPAGSARVAAASADIDDRATARAARARSRRIPRVSTLPPPDGSHESAQVSDDLTIDDGWETWPWPGKARSGEATRGRRWEPTARQCPNRAKHRDRLTWYLVDGWEDSAIFCFEYVESG